MYDVVFVVVVLFLPGLIHLIPIFICFRFIGIICNIKKTNSWLENLYQKKIELLCPYNVRAFQSIEVPIS